MNHLMIAVGGTGGRVMAGFRRLVFQQYKAVEPADLNIKYFYIDSSQDDCKKADRTEPLKEGEEQWRTLGRSVQLAPGSIVQLRQGDFANVIDHIDDYPTIKSWIGEPDAWRRIWNGAPNGIEAGGQLRRFGRFLLAQNCADVVHNLRQCFEVNDRGGAPVEAQWTVHVVAGLAGGTGSGAFLDVIGQLRKIRAGAEHDTTIILYAVLPHTEETSWAKGNYYANGYAALAELNGVLVRAFRPSDVGAAGQTYFSNPGAPVNNVFVITNRNERGLVVDMDRTLPEIAAEAMFQTIVASGDATARGANHGGADQTEWRRMVKGENYIADYEQDVADGPDTRANRFMSFGIKRIAVPHQDIREYASLSYVRQSMLQLAANNWGEGFGFTESPAPYDSTAIVRSDAAQEAWLLTDAHLMLERGSFEGEGRDWRSIHDEFLMPLNTKAEITRRDVKDDAKWLQPIEAFADDRYAKTFRRFGVAEFYRIAEGQTPQRALLIRDRVAKDLFALWRLGERSAVDISQILTQLIVVIKEKMQKSLVGMQDSSRIEKDLLEKQKSSFADYARCGGYPLCIGYSRPLAIARHCTILAELYAAKTRIIAYGYMRQTLEETEKAIQALLKDVNIVADRLKKAAELAKTRRATRIPDEDAANRNRGHLYKFYDPANVRDVMRRLEESKLLQEQQTSALRNALVTKLGAEPTFADLAKRFTPQGLIDALEGEADIQAERALGAMEAERDRILQASVLQKLYEEYQGREDDLRRFLAERVREAGSFAQFDANERINHGQGHVNRCLVAFVPPTDELADDLRPFRALVVKILEESSQGAKVEIVDVRNRGHEIVFLSMTNQFPLRYLSALARLKSKHDELTSALTKTDPDRERRKRLELYAEGDGTKLPSLYYKSTEEIRAAAYPYWLIARCASLIEERPNPRSGEPETFALTVDADGQSIPVRFGAGFAKGVEGLDLAKEQALRRRVEGYLKGVVHLEDRNRLKTALIDRANAVMQATGYDADHPSVLAIQAAVQAARELVKI